MLFHKFHGTTSYKIVPDYTVLVQAIKELKQQKDNEVNQLNIKINQMQKELNEIKKLLKHNT